MLFVILCQDKPNHEEVRLATRQAHLEYLACYEKNLVSAGPTTSHDENHMTGSMLIMDFPTIKQAREFADNDPYAKAQLFAEVIIRPWKKLLPKT